MAEAAKLTTATVRVRDNHNTEAGLTSAQSSTILSQEAAIRNLRDEQAVVVDDNGYVVGHDFGRGARVRLSPQTMRNMKDNVFTHNHPRSIGTTGVRSIGNSFSREDILTGISGDARELRAVTPRYTFSMKRPAGGWGMTPRQAANLMATAKRNTTTPDRQELNRLGWDQESVDRRNATYYDRINKEFVRLAKERYGVDIIYRHKRG